LEHLVLQTILEQRDTLVPLDAEDQRVLWGNLEMSVHKGIRGSQV